MLFCVIIVTAIIIVVIVFIITSYIVLGIGYIVLLVKVGAFARVFNRLLFG